MFQYVDFGSDADTTMRPQEAVADVADTKPSSADNGLEMVVKKSEVKDTTSINTSNSALSPLEWSAHEGYVVFL